MSENPTLSVQQRRDAVLDVLTNMQITKRSVLGDFITYAFGTEMMTIRTRINFIENDTIVAYSSPEFNIPEVNRVKTMEYFNRRNFRSKFGCLEIELETGEVRYRTSVRHGRCSADSIKAVMRTLITMHKSYFARTIYPKLVKLRDPHTDISTILDDD